MISARVAALEPSIIRQMSARRRPSSLDLSLGEPALPPSRALMDRALGKLFAGPQGYTENAGLTPLREAIAGHAALPGRDRAENVIVTVGSEEAVFLAMLGALDPGDEVLIPEPGYPAYKNIARLLGAVPVPYPLTRVTGLVARVEQVAARLTGRTRALLLNSPSNPFGAVDPLEELRALAELARRRSLRVISDEIYRDLSYGPEPPSICRELDSAVLVGGLSKSCSTTGLRLGYLVADAALVRPTILAHQLAVTCAPRLAQLFALEVFAEPARLRENVPYYAAARAALRAVQPELPADAPLLLGEGAFYAILDVSAYAAGDPMALALALLDEQDVVVVPGIAFGPSGDWFWRLSYAAGAEAAAEGLRRVARFLRSRRSVQ